MVRPIIHFRSSKPPLRATPCVHLGKPTGDTVLCPTCTGKVAPPSPRKPAPRTGLGTLIGKALALFGITEARVTEWLGRPCGCKERREKLNALTWWAAGAVLGRRTSEQLRQVMEEHP